MSDGKLFQTRGAAAVNVLSCSDEGAKPVSTVLHSLPMRHVYPGAALYLAITASVSAAELMSPGINVLSANDGEWLPLC